MDCFLNFGNRLNSKHDVLLGAGSIDLVPESSGFLVSGRSPGETLGYWKDYFLIGHSQKLRTGNRRSSAVKIPVAQALPAITHWPRSLKTLGTRLRLDRKQKNTWNVITKEVHVCWHAQFCAITFGIRGRFSPIVNSSSKFCQHINRWNF